MKLSFLGAAREVTGSCFLVETADTRFLVDCGMVQGGRAATARNREPFAFDPASIDFVLLTHAHIDHSGLLPKLARAGFRGVIHATPATADLLGVMLPDSAHIQESDAKRAARRMRGKNVLPPLYTLQDAQQCLRQVRGVEYDHEFAPGAGVRARFRDAGHILGSAIVEVRVTEHGKHTKLVFSGDLGQPGRPIVRDPAPVEDADILVIESTYGNRQHGDFSAAEEGMAGIVSAAEEGMAGIVETTLFERGGNVIVPAFAVGRTQEVLYHLHRLVCEGRLRHPAVFVDSPMAAEATRITREHLALFDEQARQLAGWHARGENLPYLRFTASAEESMALNRIRSGAIIISASGMCDAGRIRHHLRHNLPRSECSVLFPGFQAQGTLGRRLIDGARRVRIFGEDIPVRASIHSVNGLSAHADCHALLGWTSHFRRPPLRTFVVHGEPPAAEALAEHLGQQPGWRVTVPALGEAVNWPDSRALGQ
ncbi:MAG: Ribonuclease [Steroidobacteraceae bacterium]|nr:Ribonuclease [Steroidobacteraceae bacterium]